MNDKLPSLFDRLRLPWALLSVVSYSHWSVVQLALELKQNILDSPFQCGISALLKSLPRSLKWLGCDVRPNEPT